MNTEKRPSTRGSVRIPRIPQHSNSSLSRQKDITLHERTGRIKIVTEIKELKRVRKAYNKFNELFSKFNSSTGAEIVGKQMTLTYSQFKSAFDSFLSHCSQYFNSSPNTRRIGRYSPIIDFSQKLLKEWSLLVIAMNRLSSSFQIPHQQKLQEDFDMLTGSITTIAKSIVNRTYYKDNLYSSSNVLKSEITRIYQLIFKTLNGDVSEFNDAKLDSLREEMVILNRNINDNFVSQIPSNVANTPDFLRMRSALKTSCGHVISLLEAAHFFVHNIHSILNRMKKLDVTLRDLLDELDIKYRLDVTPNGEEEPSEEDVDESPIKPEIKVLEDEPFEVTLPPVTKPRARSSIRTSVVKNCMRGTI
ncbi:hypothetical protein TVAG_323710 [Trichomonas vaginalis G3]|uniref:Uncharacterized protein n=1 Tax=Trichomonas vaginalis (strain ATCC PRA-98 / G3) TaxID=412133 RepID=A2FTW5_TRIV3|nr:WD40 repeat-containing protein [Trichomonas vaginalis G3]EAX91655.1 hypothetical protein TVAG_323710 [Trichomonas vaginalis G3]KAI5539663.1 WD40 repeat-containing protein [Trichomonas vaginalis G3]|eukprot:XP_001304585.1 hypothetical protein [Trichomonas vaginalis G3]